MYLLVGDAHFGKKHFSKELFENQLKIWYEIIDKANELDIPIIHFGDLFDNRIIIDINFFNLFIEKFVKYLKEKQVIFYTIIGNHDIYYKNTRNINLVKYLPNFYDGIKVIEETTNIENITLIPWIINDIPKEYNEIIMGHFEFQGIDNIPGTINPNVFSEAKYIFSGHYHNIIRKDNILYLGTPYQLDWSDYKQKKGYWLFDNKTYKIEFIENKVSKRFIKLKYDENYENPLIISGFDKDLYFDINEIPFDILENNYFKFFINYAKTKDYQYVIFELNKRKLNFEVINNVEISRLIENDYKPKKIELNDKKLIEFIPDKYKTLINEILQWSQNAS